MSEYQRLANAVRTAEQQHERAKGRMQQAVASLKSEFEVATAAEADELLADYDAEIAQLTEALQDGLTDFAATYAPQLSRAGYQPPGE